VLNARTRLEARFPHLVEVALKPEGSDVSDLDVPQAEDDLSPLDLALQFWQAAEGASAPQEVQTELITSFEVVNRALAEGAL
jgi:hypothetical protein